LAPASSFARTARSPLPLPALSRRTWLATSAGLLAGLPGTVRGDDEPAAPPLLTYESPQTQTWKIGLILESGRTHCGNVLATFPVPTAWPEQTVRLIDQEVDGYITGWKPRVLTGGVKQVMLAMNQVPPGSEVKLLLTFEIERSRILGPEQTEMLQIPRRISGDLRFAMGNSPYIDASHPRIKAVARDLMATPADTPWTQIERTYDWVRDNIEYTEGKLMSASDALSEGKGDCEEMTSLFVALCRNQRVPARMVWIPGHCYPEFYLAGPDDEGAWFPCQAAGTRQFGRLDEYRPVLQKGDRFQVPELKAPQRYVAEFFTCKKLRGSSGEPDPNFVRELIDG
jgi:hypothetical protein